MTRLASMAHNLGDNMGSTSNNRQTKLRQARRPDRSFAASICVCLLACLCTVASASAQRSLSAQAARIERLNEALSLSTSKIASVTIDRKLDGSVTVAVPIDGVDRTLTLRKHSMRSPSFKLLVQYEASGELVEVAPPEVRTYRGTIEGIPGSRVSASLTSDQLTATIRTPSDLFAIQPTQNLGLTTVPNEHVIYRASSWINNGGFECGTTEDTAHGDVVEAVGSIAGTTGFQQVDVAIDADFEFFQLNGSSVANTVHDVEVIMDAVELAYERDVAITYEVTAIVVRASINDPYTSNNNSTLLCQFRGEWNTSPQTFIQRDVAHLFTGRNIDGSVIGTAWLSVICNPTVFACGTSGNLAYGFSQSRFSGTFSSRVALTAHELGHNWSGVHCDGDADCHIMCSGLGGCAGVSGDNLVFGSNAISRISSHRNTRSCLSPLSNPHPIPFFDDFESGTIDPNRWSYNRGGFIVSSGVNPPSAPLSLSVDAGGSQEFRDDEIRSNVIPLGGTAPHTLSYSTQHQNVASGESLIVEYWDNNLTWQPLNQITSDGINQTQFEFHSHLLPSNAIHAEFRFRFRTDVNSFADDWLIDDVRVDASCTNDVQCDDASFCNGAETCSGSVCTSTSPPCGAGETCDATVGLCLSASCAPLEIVAAGGRYLAITPPAGTSPIGLRIAPACNPAAASFVGTPSGPDNIARLVDPNSPVFLTPSAWTDTVLVTGDDIVPGTDYVAWADCGSVSGSVLSLTGFGRTNNWGDTAGAFTAGAWAAPDGSVDIPVDIVAILHRFSNRAGAPSVSRTDLVPITVACTPDGQIDIVDVAAALDAFRGLSFTATTSCASPCAP